MVLLVENAVAAERKKSQSVSLPGDSTAGEELDPALATRGMFIDSLLDLKSNTRSGRLEKSGEIMAIVFVDCRD